MSSKKQYIRRMRAENSKYFRGEMMTCVMCGKQEKSEMHYSSQWTVIEVDEKPYYVCSVCIPSKHEGATKQQFEEAYARVLRTIADIPPDETLHIH